MDMLRDVAEKVPELAVGRSVPRHYFRITRASDVTQFRTNVLNEDGEARRQGDRR